MAEKDNLATALSKAQGELPDIKKDAKGNFGKYVTLDAIHAAILPVLSKNGLAWITLPGYDENGEGIMEYQLLHTSGEKIEGKMRLLTGQQTPQGQGSALTYARRYSICSVIGITADDDDDGTSGSAKEAPAYNNKKRYAAKPKPELEDVPFEDSGIDFDAPAPMNEATMKKLTSALKLKGFENKLQVVDILNSLGADMFQAAKFTNLSDEQGEAVYTKIVATKKEALEALASMA